MLTGEGNEWEQDYKRFEKELQQFRWGRLISMLIERTVRRREQEGAGERPRVDSRAVTKID